MECLCKQAMFQLNRLREEAAKHTPTTTSSLIGLCEDMCPPMETLERHIANLLHPLERGTACPACINKRKCPPAPNKSRMVKAYHRPAAGQPPPLALNVRSLSALQKTTIFLINNYEEFCAQCGLFETYQFVSDRLRSVLLDLTLQHIRSCESYDLLLVDLNFHLCQLYFLSHQQTEKIDWKLLTARIEKSAFLLYEGISCNIISQPLLEDLLVLLILLFLNQPEFLQQLLQQADKRHLEIRTAFQFIKAYQNNNYVRFFQLVR
eukprot:m.70464 g.70464  ORF g.70464 m.70464 type:complete len:264 (-) comp20084_c0_seq1:211-1002(-)